MSSIERQSGLHDGRRGTVPSGFPGAPIDLVPFGEFQYAADDFTQPPGIGLNGRQEPVVLGGHRDDRQDALGIRGDENRRDDSVVARLMEVLEVQGVVRHLIERVPGELPGAGLELENEDDRPDDQKDVDPLAHSGDRVFKVDGP